MTEPEHAEEPVKLSPHYLRRAQQIPQCCLGDNEFKGFACVVEDFLTTHPRCHCLFDAFLVSTMQTNGFQCAVAGVVRSLKQAGNEHDLEVTDPACVAYEGVELGLQRGMPGAEPVSRFPADGLRVGEHAK